MQNGKVVWLHQAHEDEDKELHTCPYREEINGDYDTLCDCSPEETQQCAWDI